MLRYHITETETEQMALVTQHLLFYDELSPSERSEADAHLRDNPDDLLLVEEGRRLRAFMRKGGLDLQEDDLALISVALNMGHTDLPPHLQALHDSLVKAAEEDESLCREYEVLTARLRKVLQVLPDASEHFGSLQRELVPGRRSVRRRLLSAVPVVRDLVRKIGDRRRGGRIALLTAVAVTMLGAATWATSEVTRPHHERIAGLERVAALQGELRLRGDESAGVQPRHAFESAVELIEHSRRTTLGLFPRYDDADLSEAIETLDAVISREITDTALSLEARYLLARIYLHRGQLEAARHQLWLVVEREGPSAGNAANLLSQLD
jgi:hypothetical protein